MTTNEPSTVIVNGNAAAVKADNSFEGKVAVTAGDNTVTVAATDVNGNTATNRYNLTVTGSGSKTLVYDANGNLTSDGTRTFEWDSMNRLTAVNSGTNRSEFTYNGLSQRVTIVEKDNDAITSTKNLIWVGSEICEERDAGNSVAKHYYPQGMQAGSTNYYYSRDHLGSVRELTDSSGVMQARYDYDPYGRRTKLTGTVDADFGFTGHYYHQPSALHLALYRAYDADLGRWISRDPKGEESEVALYEYVHNRPLRDVDPLGLQAQNPLDALGKALSGLSKLDASASGAAELEKAFNDCRKTARSPSGCCKCCVVTMLVRWNGGDTLSYSGSGIVYDKPCSKIGKGDLESIYPAGWELHQAKVDW